MENVSTRRITAYLKGIAITGVVVGHTLWYYIPGAWRTTQGYENGMVSIFFVLSGYGIYHSLEQRVSATENLRRYLPGFYARRAWKIYPLFWFTLIVSPFFLHQFSSWHVFSFGMIAKYFGLTAFMWSYPRYDDFTWFIHAILPCYLLSPFMFLLLRKVGLRKYLALNFALIACFAATSFFILRFVIAIPDQAFVYRSFILGNFFFFSFGMTIPRSSPLFKSMIKNFATRYLLVAVAIISFALTLRYSRIPSVIFHNSEALLTPLFIVAAFILCLIFIVTRPLLPLRQAFCFLGNHSYPIYMLHLSLWGLFLSWGVTYRQTRLVNGPAGNVPLTLLMLVPFLVICVGIDRLQISSEKWFVSWRRKRMKPPETVPETGLTGDQSY